MQNEHELLNKERHGSARFRSQSKLNRTHVKRIRTVLKPKAYSCRRSIDFYTFSIRYLTNIELKPKPRFTLVDSGQTKMNRIEWSRMRVKQA